jgi:hypothetical protein
MERPSQTVREIMVLKGRFTSVKANDRFERRDGIGNLKKLIMFKLNFPHLDTTKKRREVFR